MADKTDKINELLRKIEELHDQQLTFSHEIEKLREEIKDVQAEHSEQDDTINSIEATPEPKNQKGNDEIPEVQKEQIEEKKTAIVQDIKAQSVSSIEDNIESRKKSDLERFIGENLISKIGIAILIIGIAIGAKYSIENNLISPLLRIILGYTAGLGLLVVGINLKKKYHDFSAVLVAGSMAIMYFITYAAYDFYGLIPKLLTFAVLVMFTVFSVIASMRYNRVVISHIGLVGAYAVPFLLSDGTGSITALLTYVTIINIGILVISVYKYWKSLYYSSFGLTWLVYFLWFETSYQAEQHFTPALVFLTVFFLIFYSIFLIYKLRKKEIFEAGDVISLTANTFIFYAQGYYLLDSHSTGQELLGVFTLITAVIHFMVSVILYRQKNADRNMFYLIVGLVMVFITLAVPVQLDGNWVTLLWSGEAGLLFWIGRTRKIPLYERLSYPLMLLAVISMSHDWYTLYDLSKGNSITPIFNINFLTSLIFISIFGFIRYTERNNSLHTDIKSKKEVSNLINLAISGILIASVYFSLFLEISNYWDQLYKASLIDLSGEKSMFYSIFRNDDLQRFKLIWLINFSLLYVAIMNYINIKRFKSEILGSVGLALSIVLLFIFFVQGLLLMSELRVTYISQPLSEYYSHGVMNIWIRYISYLFVGMIILSINKLIRQKFLNVDLKIAFDFLLHTSILWIASSEFITWMDLSGSDKTYKLGLSILWGVYSLILIIIGLWKNKKYLRIGAISLFGVTLIKLLVYDISHLNTIAKTVVFVSLGILLLIISFLYNKYKNIITDEQE